MPPQLLLAGIAMSPLAAILFIVSVATSEWATFDYGSRTAYVGLFKYGVKGSSQAEASYSTVPGSLVSVRAMEIIGILGSMACGGLGVMVLMLQITQKSPIKFHLFASLTSSFAALMALIGCIIFRAKAYSETMTVNFGGDLDATLGYSFYLAVLASVCVLVSGGLMYKAGKDFTAQPSQGAPQMPMR